VDSFEEAHIAAVRQVVVGDISRIVGIPHGSQCSSSDANRTNANDGRRPHVMYQTVVTLVSTHFHENKIETSVGTWVNPEIINSRT
jgi:nitrogenase molybdenum-iron protein alpha/beta subunit